MEQAEVAMDLQDQPDELTVRNPQLLEEPAPFLYCLGGRLRGRTLVSCERLNLSQLSSEAMQKTEAQSTESGEWEAVRALSEHRGSHGAKHQQCNDCIAAIIQ